MSDAASIYDGLMYLYAEQLKGKRVSLTIQAITPETITGDGGRKSQGHCLAFKETDKKLIVCGATIKRQLAIACGTDAPGEMIGQVVTLYPVESTKSVSGQAIRIDTKGGGE